jgi:hypothetical protein
MGAYNGFFRRTHPRNHSVGDAVGDSVGDIATSLYGYHSLNPSVFPSVKSPDVTMPLRISKRNVYSIGEIGRYIPMEIFRRYIPTDFETE